MGEAIDASQPTVRTLVVGTEEAADAYVRNALSGLGIGQEPVGFTWSNAAIGSADGVCHRSLHSYKVCCFDRK